MNCTKTGLSSEAAAVSVAQEFVVLVHVVHREHIRELAFFSKGIVDDVRYPHGVAAL